MTALPEGGITCPCPWVARGICNAHQHYRPSVRSPWTCLMHDHTEANPPTVEDQPPSVPNDSVPVWNLVIADMQDRDRIGRERYGTPLQTFNGRKHLVDAYQEGLDFVVYVRAEIEEREQLAISVGELHNYCAICQGNGPCDAPLHARVTEIRAQMDPKS